MSAILKISIRTEKYKYQFNLTALELFLKIHRSMMNSGEWTANMTYTTCDEYNEESPLPRRNVDLRRYLKDVRTRHDVKQSN